MRNIQSFADPDLQAEGLDEAEGITRLALHSVISEHIELLPE